MARADDRRRTTEHRSTDPCAVMRHPSPAPANSSASRRNQKTFASHVRDGLRSSHPSPMHHFPRPGPGGPKRKNAKHHPARPDPGALRHGAR